MKLRMLVRGAILVWCAALCSLMSPAASASADELEELAARLLEAQGRIQSYSMTQTISYRVMPVAQTKAEAESLAGSMVFTTVNAVTGEAKPIGEEAARETRQHMASQLLDGHSGLYTRRVAGAGRGRTHCSDDMPPSMIPPNGFRAVALAAGRVPRPDEFQERESPVPCHGVPGDRVVGGLLAKLDEVDSDGQDLVARDRLG